MFGFFNVNKPPGPTSHDVVARVRRMLRRRLGCRIKIGHTGTLDPFAGGVLVLCAGGATRLADYVQRLPKRYLAEITLGATSSTDDSEGEITAATNAALPDESAVRAAVAQFVGEIRQVPPAHSAVHVDGRRAYELARKGLTPNLDARGATVYSIDVTAWQPTSLEIDVRCGSGTYIRALARDIGAALGVGGYCSSLVRTQVGPFGLDRAVGPDELAGDVHLLDPMIALADMPRVTLSAAETRRLSMGQRFRPIAAPHAAADEAAVVDDSGALLAIAAVDADGLLRPHKVFIPTS